MCSIEALGTVLRVVRESYRGLGKTKKERRGFMKDRVGTNIVRRACTIIATRKQS